MSEQQLDKNMSLEQDKLSNNEMEIDLIEIFRKVINIRRTLYKAAGVGLILGIIIALSIPRKYTVEVTLSPEMGTSKGNGGLASMAASLLGTGGTMSEGMDALNASLSSDIITSTPFLLELLSMDVPTDIEEKMTLECYLDTQSSPWWSYVIGFPSMVVSGMKSFFSDKNDTNSLRNNGFGTIELTQKEDEKITSLKKNITVVVDKKTAITNISITLQNPRIAAAVADSVVHKLQEYIISYRTSKAKEDCIYLERLFRERQEEYYAAQKEYADYVDTHDNLILQSVRAEQERLQNDLSLAYQIYSQVANQLQVARAKVQEEKPVFAIVEPAVVPLYPSDMGMKMYVLLFVVFTVLITVVWSLFGKDLLNNLKKETK